MQLFQFGAQTAGIDSDCAEFSERFSLNFRECMVTSTSSNRFSQPLMEVFACAGHGAIKARLTGLGGKSDAGLFLTLFPELVFEPPASVDASGWLQLKSQLLPSVGFAVRSRAEWLEVDRALPWQALLGHFFVHCVMAMQPRLLFLHAASLGIGDKGILLCGDKGAGKSTLSLALAARGHSFLGDETAAVDARSRQLLPFRRRASMRVGPQASAVSAYLAQHPLEQEVLPDGSVRTRVLVSEMFQGATARPLKLVAAFFLGRRTSDPRIQPVDFAVKDLASVSPLAATMTAISPLERAMTFLKLFNSVQCFGLNPGGTPDQTADLIEQAMEGVQ